MNICKKTITRGMASGCVRHSDESLLSVRFKMFIDNIKAKLSVFTQHPMKPRLGGKYSRIHCEPCRCMELSSELNDSSALLSIEVLLTPTRNMARWTAWPFQIWRRKGIIYVRTGNQTRSVQPISSLLTSWTNSCWFLEFNLFHDFTWYLFSKSWQYVEVAILWNLYSVAKRNMIVLV